MLLIGRGGGNFMQSGYPQPASIAVRVGHRDSFQTRHIVLVKGRQGVFGQIGDDALTRLQNLFRIS